MLHQGVEGPLVVVDGIDLTMTPRVSSCEYEGALHVSCVPLQSPAGKRGLASGICYSQDFAREREYVDPSLNRGRAVLGRAQFEAPASLEGRASKSAA